jgi:chromate transporter
MLIKNGILPAFGTPRDLRAPLIAAVLALIYFGSRKVLKKGISPILLIVIAACLGVGVYGIK